ncbi:protein CBFA2T1-like isoform X2 [Amphiura filiformis]|uniref:protein CBFA2T1-like isoform X2 n=1 Tax=Amphiura filiformis TaxID=82378 RepID=UPI003B21F74E
MGKSEILRKSTSPLSSPTPIKIKVEREPTPTTSSSLTAAAPIGNISAGPGGTTSSSHHHGAEVPPLPPPAGNTCSKAGRSGSPPEMQALQQTTPADSKPITLSKLMHARAQRSEYYQGTGVFSFELHRQSNHTDIRMPDSPVDSQSHSKTTAQTSPNPSATQTASAAMATHSRSHSTSSASGSMVNGMHSPRSINGGTPSPPSSMNSATSAGQEVPPACGARQLSKLKRFLTTLQQFGSDISPEIGERVRGLVMGLVNNALTVEDFHNKLQEATNFPLRPFVIPFLKANLPLLQRELMHCARIAKMTPQQYYMQNEQQLLDVKAPSAESESLMDVNENGKRRTPDERTMNRPKENGTENSTADGPAPKRQCTLSPGHGPGHYPAGQGSGGHHQIRMEDLAHAREMREMRERYERERGGHPPFAAGFSSHRDSVYPDPMLFDDRIEDDWKHVDTMLQCIVGMVEKTKRALAVLHQRSIQDREELALWVRRHSEGTEHDMKKRAGEMMAHTIRQTEDRVSEVKRRAEEAVNEVKRQAVSELQKAVTAAEQKANEMVNAERAKLDRAVVEARRQAAEEAVSLVNHQDDSSESCWNCGRKANETCSGCNTARYCGAFCQHKDWENHHKACGQYAAQANSTDSSTAAVTIAVSSGSTASSSVPTSAPALSSMPAASPAGSTHSNHSSTSRTTTPTVPPPARQPTPPVTTATTS